LELTIANPSASVAHSTLRWTKVVFPNVVGYFSTKHGAPNTRRPVVKAREYQKPPAQGSAAFSLAVEALLTASLNRFFSSA